MNKRTDEQMKYLIVYISQSLMALYTDYTTRPDVSIYKAPLAAAEYSMCGSRKYPYSPHGRSFLGGGGS